MTQCNCWVRNVPEPECWSLHNGAHELDCPVFRVSLDPVDAMHDAEVRERKGPYGQPGLYA